MPWQLLLIIGKTFVSRRHELHPFIHRICTACPSVQPHAGTFRSFLLSITQSRDSSSSLSLLLFLLLFFPNRITAPEGYVHTCWPDVTGLEWTHDLLSKRVACSFTLMSGWLSLFFSTNSILAPQSLCVCLQHRQQGEKEKERGREREEKYLWVKMGWERKASVTTCLSLTEWCVSSF